METVEKLEVKLAAFAKKHKESIQGDPAFRAKFLEMCAPMGIDLLARSTDGFWGSMGLGIGEFYYELSVKVAEVCLASRSRNGGIIKVSEVKSILTARGTKFQFSNSKNKSSYSKCPRLCVSLFPFTLHAQLLFCTDTHNRNYS